MARAPIIEIISSNAVSLDAVSGSIFSGTYSGTKMYPNFLFVAFDNLNALPEACTISTLDLFGSAKQTQSIAGKSTPSVKHLALVINPLPSANNLI